jgi:hypothetical protein
MGDFILASRKLLEVLPGWETSFYRRENTWKFFLDG